MITGLPDAATLADLLRYDPPTGRLFWKPRQEDYFSGIGEQRSRLCALWNRNFAGKPALNALDNGYRVGRLLTRNVSAHRTIWALHTGSWPTHQIDHINGVRDDNRIENLREVTARQNKRNARLDRRNKSGVSGVCFDTHNGVWVARITLTRRRVFLGAFDTLEAAAAARKAAEENSDYAAAHGSEDRPYYIHRRDATAERRRIERVESKMAEEARFIETLRRI